MPPHSTARPRRRLAAALLALAAVTATAACSGGGGDKAQAVDRAPTTTAPRPAPLTGLALSDPSIADRPVLSVKVDNAPAARPQSGLDQADVVFEEVVEGGVTRFLAMFHSTDVDEIGPVRSVRPVDAQIVTPVRGGFAYSGGIPPFVALLRQAPVVDVGIDSLTEAYDRKAGRRAPHNTYTSTGALYEGVDGQPGPPQLFTFLPAGQAFGGGAAGEVTGFTVPFGLTTARFEWDDAGSAWKRSTDGRPHLNAAGQQLAPTNVIVMFVPYAPTGSVDASDSRVFTADTLGAGEAWVFADGRLVKGRWSRATAGDVVGFTDAAGAPVQIPPGRTWVLLPGTGTDVAVDVPPPPTSVVSAED